MNKKNASLYLKSAASLFLIAFLLSQTELENYRSIFTSLDIKYFLLGYLFIHGSMVLGAMSLLKLTPNSEVSPNNRLTFYSAFYLSNLIGLALPGRVGDFSIALMLSKITSKTQATASVIKDKLLTVSVFGGCGTITFLLLDNLTLATTCLLILICTALLHFTLTYFSQRKSSAPAAQTLLTFLQKKLASLDKTPNTKLTAAIGIKILRLGFTLAGTLLLLKSMNLDIPTLPTLASIITVHLSALLPISIQGIGVNEVLYIYHLENHGLTIAHAITLAFTLRIITLLTLTSLYSYYSVRKKLAI
ncbi:lysylphosphatidylglycerol synthase transmembrane domain-containing protein [Simiduia aestuariiviva]|uniref:Uncharacterized membrane protein YbhN (UPF0104 family) n=1 Tax=Simiduia aestuariiviva TaxID=1510459 RepID=A0A839UMK0_9GAMM|nr:lysylphosphatidylglycerol synthase transmembrane domain-containing protein [Simiduia aestuariiviva]MBB3169082.1 uncharacterized membrane protein YbhN (UPF0104 family) [Simiduia aestuariiviva]